MVIAVQLVPSTHLHVHRVARVQMTHRHIGARVHIVIAGISGQEPGGAVHHVDLKAATFVFTVLCHLQLSKVKSLGVHRNF